MLCWQLEITHWYVGTFAGEGAYRLIEDFDDDGDGVLNKNEFVNFMASLQRDAGNDVYLSLQVLQRHKCVVVWSHPSLKTIVDSAEDAVRSFSVMVEDNRRSSGKVDMDTVVHILRSVGEPLSDQECRHLVEDAKPDIDHDGKLDYSKFIHRLLKQI